MLSLRKTNNLLLTLIIIINGYVVIAPFYPQFYLWWQTTISHKPQKLEKLIRPAQAHSTKSSPREGEWIIIPKIALDTPIFEGPTVSTANKGVWHRPNSSFPGKGSNTVLAGHRFTYTQPKGIFYNLDKLTKGDSLALFWDGKQYTYKVTEVKTVPPTDAQIEFPSDNDRLTLYTCTPLWSAKDRLVVIAERSGS